MERELTPYEQFIEERDKEVIEMFQKMEEAGTARMHACTLIGNRLKPPMHSTSIIRILKRNGVDIKPAQFGRRPKVA